MERHGTTDRRFGELSGYLYAGGVGGVHWVADWGSGDGVNPLGAPGGGFEGIGEVLGFVDDLLVAEFHDADGEGRAALVDDGVFGDPEIAFSQHSPDLEARGFARVMAAQRLEVFSAEDALA